MHRVKIYVALASESYYGDHHNNPWTWEYPIFATVAGSQGMDPRHPVPLRQFRCSRLRDGHTQPRGNFVTSSIIIGDDPIRYDISICSMYVILGARFINLFLVPVVPLARGKLQYPSIAVGKPRHGFKIKTKLVRLGRDCFLKAHRMTTLSPREAFATSAIMIGDDPVSGLGLGLGLGLGIGSGLRRYLDPNRNQST